ncbi:MAG: hypothetical protein JWM98_195 [Thermoleophilia bacterium]|nr:hypothetical protein [Thermoleophilia bacterium]
MGSVNPTTPSTLPATTTPAAPTPAPAEGETPQAPIADPSSHWSFADGLSAMGSSVASVSKDVGNYTGTFRTGDDGPRFDVLTVGGIVGANAGISGAMALAKRTDPLTGVKMGLGDTLQSTAQTMGTNTLRVTPTLVSAILGPAVADGVTMIAPNLVKKYKNTAEIKDLAVKKQTEKDNQNAKIARAVVGGAVVGLAAGAVFLLKPDLFKGFGVNFVSDEAIQGATHYTTSTGRIGSLTGVLTGKQIGESLKAIGKPLLDGESVNVVKTMAPMARDAAFSNRAVLGTAGGIGTLLLANKTAGADDRDKVKWGAITAAAGALTIGATYGVGKLTERSMLANEGAGGILAKNQMLWKPNIGWIKSYASKIAPITAIPAGTAASQYFNVVSDFDDITSARSPFRK